MAPDGAFIHVLDDATLDILLGELDTISDFTAYLTKKEAFIRSSRLVFAGGEEDLLAYYMKTMNAAGQHDFSKPDGASFGEGEHITFEPGLYADVRRHPQYIAKRQADRTSYLWDNLINAFTQTVMDGTSLVPDGQSTEVAYLERGLRHMALVSRFHRRIMGDGIAGALQKSLEHERFSRSFVPGPTDPNQETAFFFMTIAVPSFQLPGGYDQYRQMRVSMLEAYGYALLEKHPKLRRVVGIAREPLSREADTGLSEDLMILEDVVWNDELKRKLTERKKIFNIMTEGNLTERPAQGNEFPDVLMRSTPYPFRGNRKERRRRMAQARRKASKPKR